MNIPYDEIIRRSNINNSTSKQAHKFPQSPRFVQAQPVCTRNSYDLTPLMMSSGVKHKDKVIPQSSRFIIHADNTPSPGSYNTISSFNLKKFTKNGPSIDQTKRFFFIDKINVPGPGAYSPKNVSQKHISMSMRARLSFPKQKESLGPGQYSIEKYDSLNVTNFQSIYSKYANTKNSKIGKQARFNQQKGKETSPGPGKYFKQNKNSFEVGRYSFGRERRNASFIKQSSTPGPGNYKQFSQFADRRKELFDKLQKIQKIIAKDSSAKK